jgi:23S rRNA pseudouridine2605 synthase
MTEQENTLPSSENSENESQQPEEQQQEQQPQIQGERVQKILARAGIASRRKAEELITEGSVTVNGKVAQLGDRAVFGKDSIKVNGKLIHKVEAPIYLSFYKPKNVISSLADPEGRPSVGDYLKRIEERVYPVGRLDFTSEGLLILTNDGNMAEQLQKREDIPRFYHVKVKGHPDREMVERLEKGAKLENRYVKPHAVRVLKELQNKAVVEVVILGGGPIDLKLFFESKGFLVERIARVGFGHLSLRGMSPGEFDRLQPSSIEALLNQPELGLKRLEGEIEKQEEREARREEREARGEKLGDRRAVRARGEAGPAGAGGSAAIPRPRRDSSQEEVQSRDQFLRDDQERGERPAKRFGGAGGGRGFDRGERAPRSGGFGGGERGGFKRGFDRGERSFDRGERAPRSGGFGGGERRFDGERGPRFGGERSFDRGDRAPRSGGFGGGERGGFKRGFDRGERSFDRGPSKPRWSDERGGGFDRPRPSSRFGGNVALPKPIRGEGVAASNDRPARPSTGVRRIVRGKRWED